MEDGVRVGQRVVAGVVAEGALGAQLLGVHVAFQHDLGVGRHLDIHRLALDHLHRLLADESGHQHLVDAFRQRQRSGEADGRIGADGHRHLDAASAVLRLAVVRGAALVDVPVHARGPLVEDLHAIHAAVALAGLRVLGEDQREGDVPAGVLRPALEDGDAREGRRVPHDHLLAGTVLHGFRKGACQLLELGEHHELAQQALGAA